MAVVKLSELLENIRTKIGDSTTDEDIQLLENISDTFNTLSENENWKSKYEDNDKNWREKYKARFFDAPATPPGGQGLPSNGAGDPPVGQPARITGGQGQPPKRAMTFEELFKTE